MKHPFVLGLTGSIGMGKSTVAGFFRESGVPVWDADETVRRLYAKRGAGVAAIAELCPEAVVDGKVSRPELRRWIAREAGALARLEQAIHPLVAQDREDFLIGAEAAEEELVVLDIPLLFETGADVGQDAVLVVTAPPEVQRERVLARLGMTEDSFQRLLSKQVPDDAKRARADYIIQSVDLDTTHAAVQALIKKLRERLADA